MICSSMTHVKCVACFLILANDNESISSDESLPIEFPPPPSAFSTPSINDNPSQFVPVKNPFVQTTIIRSDSGKNSSIISYKIILFISILFYSLNHHHKSRRIIFFLSCLFCMFCGGYIYSNVHSVLSLFPVKKQN